MSDGDARFSSRWHRVVPEATAQDAQWLLEAHVPDHEPYLPETLEHLRGREGCDLDELSDVIDQLLRRFDGAAALADELRRQYLRPAATTDEAWRVRTKIQEARSHLEQLTHGDAAHDPDAPDADAALRAALDDARDQRDQDGVTGMPA